MKKIRLYSRVESELRSFATALGAEDKYEIVKHFNKYYPDLEHPVFKTMLQRLENQKQENGIIKNFR